MQGIIGSRKRSWYDFDHEKLASYLGSQDIMPSVKIDGDKAVVTYYFWTAWGGLCKFRVPVEKDNESIIFGNRERQTLVKYDCGIRY